MQPITYLASPKMLHQKNQRLLLIIYQIIFVPFYSSANMGWALLLDPRHIHTIHAAPLCYLLKVLA